MTTNHQNKEEEMPGEHQNHVAVNTWLWSDRLMWSVILMFLLGSVARTFVSNEPFDVKKFVGEIIFSAIGAVMMYSMGLMQGMSEAQIVCFGAMASLGGIRSFEWFIKIAKNVKAASSIGDK